MLKQLILASGIFCIRPRLIYVRISIFISIHTSTITYLHLMSPCRLHPTPKHPTPSSMSEHGHPTLLSLRRRRQITQATLYSKTTQTSRLPRPMTVQSFSPSTGRRTQQNHAQRSRSRTLYLEYKRDVCEFRGRKVPGVNVKEYRTGQEDREEEGGAGCWRE
jgi:hypothetical protein